MRRGEITNRIDAYSSQPKFKETFKRLGLKYAVANLKEISEKIFSGTTPQAKGDAYTEDENTGVPFVRSGEITEEGRVSKSVLYIKKEVHEGLMQRSKLQKGDLLIAIVGATIGSVGIYQYDTEANINQAIAAIRLLENKALPEYISWFLSTPIGQTNLDFLKRPVARANINLEEIGKIQIPLPDLGTQHTLVADMESARLAQQQKLSQADELLKGIDGFVLEQLRLELQEEEKQKKVFAARFSEIKKRTDPDYHSPYFRMVRSAIQQSKFKVVKLSKILAKPFATGFAAGRNDQAEDELSGVPHVRPFNISPNGEFTLKTAKYVPSKNVAKNDWLTKDEVLFNNTNSTEWVGKTAVFDSDISCACSNHITRLSLDRKQAEPLFIAAQLNMFRSLGIFGLLSTNFNNQAGINSETLSEFEILLPSLEVQGKIAAEVSRRRAQARQLREAAKREWQNAKESFEKALLG